MPCLKKPTCWIAPGLLALAAGVAQAAAPANEPDVVVRARMWLSGRYQALPASFGIQPPDTRLLTRDCPGGNWLFDQPYPANEGMLRARCPEASAQVFLQVKLPAAAPAPSASGAAQAAAATSPARPAPVMAPPAAPAPVVAPPVISGPPLVRRGQIVLTTFAPVPGLSVSARLEAMDDGRLGETIRLKNRESGRIVTAIVNGQNSAQGQ